MGFKIIASDQHARCGQLAVNGKQIQTPAFVPAAVLNQENCLMTHEMRACQVRGLTVNLSELLWRFGLEELQQKITLPHFLSWQGLLIAHLGNNADLADHVRNFTTEGLQLQSPINGQKFWLRPEVYIHILQQLLPDIIISFYYQCLPKASKVMALKDNERQLLTMNDYWRRISQKTDQTLVVFVPLCEHQELQDHVIDEVNAIETEGYAFDNSSISISKDNHLSFFQKVLSKLSVEKIRYFSAIRTIDELIMVISCGVDLIESQEPIKKARAGQLFTLDGEIHLNVKSVIKKGSQPIDSHCGCYTCKNFTREYLQYLSWNNIMLGQRLNAIHNIYFYQQLMLNIQNAIKQGCWPHFSLRLRHVFSGS